MFFPRKIEHAKNVLILLAGIAFQRQRNFLDDDTIEIVVVTAVGDLSPFGGIDDFFQSNPSSSSLRKASCFSAASTSSSTTPSDPASAIAADGIELSPP